jgi:hypothetical protein
MRAFPVFDVFLSHSHDDAEWVQKLARRLEDDHAMKVWLDSWVLVPGKSWQQGMAKGLNEAKTCAVCIGKNTPTGWFREEIERALDMQTKDSEFRVIPVLLPNANASVVSEFLSLRTWADFRNGRDEGYAIHVLVQGIRGEPTGRWPVSPQSGDAERICRERLEALEAFRGVGLSQEVVIEFQRRSVAEWYESKKKK